MLERDGDAWAVTAEQVILAVPGRVRRVIGVATPGVVPATAPWRVAQLHCDQPPHSVGVSQAWDSVRYEGRGLGVVTSTWQTTAYGGPTTLSSERPEPLRGGELARGQGCGGGVGAVGGGGGVGAVRGTRVK